MNLSAQVFEGTHSHDVALNAELGGWDDLFGLFDEVEPWLRAKIAKAGGLFDAGGKAVPLSDLLFPERPLVLFVPFPEEPLQVYWLNRAETIHIVGRRPDSGLKPASVATAAGVGEMFLELRSAAVPKPGSPFYGQLHAQLGKFDDVQASLPDLVGKPIEFVKSILPKLKASRGFDPLKVRVELESAEPQVLVQGPIPKSGASTLSCLHCPTRIVADEKGVWKLTILTVCVKCYRQKAGGGGGHHLQP